MTTRLLTTADAAQVLGVSRPTIVRMIHAGSLPYVDVSADPARVRYRLDPADLDAWIDQHRHTLDRKDDSA